MTEIEKPKIPVGASRILPPVWFLGAILAMVAIWYGVPGTQVTESSYVYAGIILMAAGVALAVYGKKQFDLANTPVRPFTKTTALVKSGPFRFSRNPMYLAMVIVLIGVGLVLGKIAPFAVIPLFIMWIRSRFIRYEEQIMAAQFGAAYLDYKNRVRRWI